MQVRLMENEQMDTMIDQHDYRLELARHIPSGKLHVLRYNSLWDEDDECVGWTYTRCSGPLAEAEWVDDAGVSLAGWLDRAYDKLADADDGNAEWANAQLWDTLVTQP